MTPLASVLERLEAVRRCGDGFVARCPAHPDRMPSLSVTEGDDGRVLVHCHAGCSTEAVVSAVDLSVRDLFADTSRTSASQRPLEDRVYRYRDEAGQVLFEVVRYIPKAFRQRRPDGSGGYVWNLRGVRMVPYRLDEMVRAVADGRRVFIVEGEKDADAIVAVGECATTSPGGAGKWHKVAEVAATVLSGAEVVVVADRDEAGRRHARAVAEALTGVASSVVVREAAVGKDVADHLAAGLTLEELVDLEDSLEPTQEPSANLPASFWQSRAVLAHLRQAAHHRGRSADAVLGAVLARVSALTPPTVTLPAIVGSRASLNVIHAVVASSGGGKSTAVGVAGDVLPWPMGDHLEATPQGSGEGVVEAFHSVMTVDGKRQKVQTRDRVLIQLDEGQALTEIGTRKGSTLLPTLRSAWSGELLGQANATVDTHRVLRAHSYRLAVLVGVQLEHAAPIIADAAGGTPQRFCWFNANDPTVPDDAPAWPGHLEVSPPPEGELDVHPEIAAEIRRQALAVTRGEARLEPLDSHGNLVRLKVGGLLAILDGRRSINVEDWELAGEVWRVSCAVRQRIIETARDVEARRESARTHLAVRREVAISESAEQRALDGMARAIARKAHRSTEPLTRRDLHSATKGAWRRLATLEDAIDVCLREGWLAADGDRFIAGKSQPR